MSSKLGPDDRHVFSDAIAESGVKPECPRCDRDRWEVLEGDYAFIKLSSDPTHVGSPGLPCAVSICAACGFVSMHAIGVLDFSDAAE